MNRTEIAWTDRSGDGNRVVRPDGYVLVRCPAYPAAKPNGYVFEHRLVMARIVGRPLFPEEVVHHVNHDRSDNRPENLRLTDQIRHTREHAAECTKEQLQSRANGLVAYQRARRFRRSLIPCGCGCGEQIEDLDDRARPRRFVPGHNQRGRRWSWRRRA